MIVIFALQADNEHFPVAPRADLMVASVRKHMPQAKIIQLSNKDYPDLLHVDEVHRRPNRGDFIEWAFGATLDIINRGENILQIATDVLINDDVSSVFLNDFNIAACRYPQKDRADGAFCGDVNFIKPSSRVFWQMVESYYLSHPEIRDGWEGGQKAFLEVSKHYKVHELPYDEYCYTPDDYDEDVSKAKIIHFRGNRKGMMGYYAKSMKLLMPYSATVVGNVSDECLEANVREALKLDVEMLSNQYMTPKEEELVIVGGGPSLKETLGEIYLKQRAGAHIWALNNTFKYLCEHGIEPDVHILLDARHENIEFVPDKTDAIMLYSAQCHPLVLGKAMLAGRLILWCPSIANILKILNEYGKTAAIIQGGSSVGLKAIALAHVLGHKAVHLYGYDSSYRDNNNHAYPQPLNDKERVIDITMNGREFRAAPWMATQACEFKDSLPNFINMGLELYVHGDGLIPHIAKSLE